MDISPVKKTTELETFIQNLNNNDQPIILSSSSSPKTHPILGPKVINSWNAKKFLNAQMKGKVFTSDSNNFLYSNDTNEQITENNYLNFDQFLEKAVKLESDDKNHYYFQEPLSQKLVNTEIFQDFQQFDWSFLRSCSKNFGPLTKNVIFISAVKNVNNGNDPKIKSQLHFDEQHNIFCQIKGTKKILLFPPSQYTNLYPYPAYSKYDRQSSIRNITEIIKSKSHNPEIFKKSIESKEFPKLKLLQGAQLAELSAGEVLFIPSYWWHEVETTSRSADDSLVDKFGSLRLNVSLNFWYREKQTQSQEIQNVISRKDSKNDFDAKTFIRISRNIEKLLSKIVANPETDYLPFLRLMMETTQKSEEEDKNPMTLIDL